MRINLEIGIVKRALELAQREHALQVRKYTGAPYVDHCVEVAELVQQARGCSPAMVAAALCHDTIEDTRVTRLMLADVIAARATSLVVQVTKPDNMRGGTREQRFQHALRKLKLASAEAQTIKYADIISNVRGLVDLDPDFARIYLPEKEQTIYWLDKGDKGLRDHAYELVKAGLMVLRDMDHATLKEQARVDDQRLTAEAEHQMGDTIPGWGMF